MGKGIPLLIFVDGLVPSLWYAVDNLLLWKVCVDVVDLYLFEGIDAKPILKIKFIVSFTFKVESNATV